MHPESLEFASDEFVPEREARVRIRWLGTAGFEIQCEDHVVLLDPYLTRASLRRSLSPERVLLSHWDNFFLPLSEPARALPAVGLMQLADRLASSSRDVRMGTLPIRGVVGL